jgi:hypothetical protein
LDDTSKPHHLGEKCVRVEVSAKSENNLRVDARASSIVRDKVELNRRVSPATVGKV